MRPDHDPLHPSHDPIRCFVPPHVLDHLVGSHNPAIRRLATRTRALAASTRADRARLAALPVAAAPPPPTAGKRRLVYDIENALFGLPGRLVRSEGEAPTGDPAADEAYLHSGTTYDFYRELFGRNSLDDRGLSLLSSVHFGEGFANAFWNGEQMLYGDGDGAIFLRFTRALDVVGHELTHGVVQYECNLEYHDEPGALNEHFADVFGILVKQWRSGQTAAQADWLVGEEILGPAVHAKGIRTFRGEKAYVGDPVLGTDPQPKHLRDLYNGPEDRGGVHLNSGIPNHAFYRAAIALGGRAWETVGWIWYETLKRLGRSSGFREAARASIEVAGWPRGGKVQQEAVKAAWAAVGIAVE